mmetsp:Transcript_36263/g.117247  ORF Transcript_36263/g.117247 Transcript_36263/m.117247 type:complete len:247 (+) Transcript_36263:3489-4229(+)
MARGPGMAKCACSREEWNASTRSAASTAPACGSARGWPRPSSCRCCRRPPRMMTARSGSTPSAFSSGCSAWPGSGTCARARNLMVTAWVSARTCSSSSTPTCSPSRACARKITSISSPRTAKCSRKCPRRTSCCGTSSTPTPRCPALPRTAASSARAAAADSPLRTSRRSWRTPGSPRRASRCGPPSWRTSSGRSTSEAWTIPACRRNVLASQASRCCARRSGAAAAPGLPRCRRGGWRGGGGGGR